MDDVIVCYDLFIVVLRWDKLFSDCVFWFSFCVLFEVLEKRICFGFMFIFDFIVMLFMLYLCYMYLVSYGF